ncbi:hypothetical protein TrVE_jg1048 [Triparma verrucosa]|uniref:Alcohol dehydrogenase-like C-terminal domain-containing protein n=1 Tax=Triparma verrucosa TaxID=1606542 RepID=A0A9W7BAW9_9STRA|nr:hypothetical protein TrVE_jg1048 [Triparma verrucosa]
MSLSKLEDVTLCVSSNSPRAHVLKCLSNLGLPPSTFSKIITPSSSNGFKTKSSPKFYDQVLEELEDGVEIVVIDDNERVLEVVETVDKEKRRIKTHLITDDNDLRDVLLKVQGCVGVDSLFEFDEVKYLRAKNVVDDSAINEDVWRKLLVALGEIPAPFNTHLKIVDVGAGLLHMLRRFVSPTVGVISPESKVQSVEYHAYEGNVRLLPEILSVMEEMGFRTVTSSPPYTFFKEFRWAEDKHGQGRSRRSWWWSWGGRGGDGGEIIEVEGRDASVTVYLHMRDFRDDANEEEGASKPPDLIVGSCFADLFDPEDLIANLKKIAKRGSTLLYFPITYGGMTTCGDMRPATEQTPSDTKAFAIYNEALEDQGHNLDPSRIISAIEKHGGSVLGSGASVWKIDEVENAWMWKTMMYFFGTTAAAGFADAGYDIKHWLALFKKGGRNLRVYNRDILARLGGDVERGGDLDGGGGEGGDVEIVFEEPRKVSTRRIHLEDVELGDDEIEIESICSLISTGTELKVFRGDVDTDSCVDVNIDDMKDETFTYPMTYGYCLVGKVVRCGAGVEESLCEKLMGRNVFTFAPHSTRVIAKAESVLLVPRDVDPYDAIFLPSVETALGLIHDAEFRVGERVGVVGQGLIGLLVTAILAKSGVDVTAFEMLEDRAALSGLLGAKTVLDPRTDQFNNNLDCAIEVSGVGPGLQTAIDRVGDGGKIVIGSLYGVGKVELGLGMDFHRSKKRLITSQVSEIPARLAGRWDKQRRFDLAWDMIRQIGVNKILGSGDVVRLEPQDAQRVFEGLESGENLVVAFDLKRD